MQMPVCTWTFLLKIGATNHPGKGLDPPPPQTGNAQMNRDIFMLVLPLVCINYAVSQYLDAFQSLKYWGRKVPELQVDGLGWLNEMEISVGTS